MPSGTTFNPLHNDEFNKNALKFDAQGVSTNPTAGTSTNLDLMMTDDCLLNGIELIISGATLGDYVALQVVDTTGAFSGVAGTIMIQPATNWYVSQTSDTQFDIVYPAKIYAGLTLRAVYTSTGLTSPFLAVNYKLHKVLI